MTDRQLKDLILETAKRNPHILTSALREAGNFCYLLIPDDIREYINEREVKDLDDADNDEIGDTLRWRNSKMSDLINYGDLCSDVVDSLRIARHERQNSNPE